MSLVQLAEGIKENQEYAGRLKGNPSTFAVIFNRFFIYGGPHDKIYSGDTCLYSECASFDFSQRGTTRRLGSQELSFADQQTDEAG